MAISNLLETKLKGSKNIHQLVDCKAENVNFTLWFLISVGMQWFKTRDNDGKKEVFDPVRRKYVALTPEEEVRQTTLYNLVTNLEMPAGLIAVEHSLKLNQLDKRCDIAVFSPEAKALMVVECKAKSVQITQAALDQVTRYNMVLNVDHLLLTNGLIQFCIRYEGAERKIVFLNHIPNYTELLDFDATAKKNIL